MTGVRNVVSTLGPNGEEVMGPDILIWHFPDNSIMNGSLLTNPARLTSFLDAATKAITVDKQTSFSDLRTLASSLQGMDPKRVTFYTAPIANPDYSPPGTSMTGRVLLDDVAGRRLYDSVIKDVPLTAIPRASMPA